MSHSTVSRQLKQLEAAMGVQLLNRTTRRFALTAAGERYHQYSLDIPARLDAMTAAMTGEREHLAGPLRVTVPLAIGTLELPDWLPAFQASFPDFALDLSCSDQFVDLVAERFDVALRISSTPLADSTSHYYALYPHTRHLTPRARAFVEFMAAHYRMDDRAD